jgi:hypothetical protein
MRCGSVLPKEGAALLTVPAMVAGTVYSNKNVDADLAFGEYLFRLKEISQPTAVMVSWECIFSWAAFGRLIVFTG